MLKLQGAVLQVAADQLRWEAVRVTKEAALMHDLVLTHHCLLRQGLGTEHPVLVHHQLQERLLQSLVQRPHGLLCRVAQSLSCFQLQGCLMH